MRSGLRHVPTGLATSAPTFELAGMHVVDWSGVRVFNDAVSADAAPPSGIELEQLLDAEDLAGRRDPYRWMASQLHVVAAHTPT